jgi:hypothetical protein
VHLGGSGWGHGVGDLGPVDPVDHCRNFLHIIFCIKNCLHQFFASIFLQENSVAQLYIL